MKDIVKMSTIYYDEDELNTEIDEDCEFMQIYKVFNKLESYQDDNLSKWVLRLEFDRETLMNKNISMDDIYMAIYSYYKDDISCNYSDDNSGKMIFRIRLNLDTNKNDDRDIIYLKNFEKYMLENIVIKGVNKITNVILRQDKNNTKYKDGEYSMEDQWVLDTDGTNLLEILSNSKIDTNRTYSNDINEVFQVLGIDAAKRLLLKEINEVIDFSGNYVNHRHLSLLTDLMTNKGYLMSIDRFGINRDQDVGPLAKCSFEETTEQIFKASIFGEMDKLNGVSANIMMGQVIPAGTGESNLLLDEMKIIGVKPTKQEVKKQDIIDDNYCSNNIGIDFDIDDIKPNTI